MTTGRQWLAPGIDPLQAPLSLAHMIKQWLGLTPAPRLRVLMVCMGNICRSPMAEAVLRGKLQGAGLDKLVAVDSAGTHGSHRGSPADPRAVSQARLRGYRVDGLKSRPLEVADFSRFDLLLAMDRNNLASLQSRCPPESPARLELLLGYAAAGVGLPEPVLEVPDPYYGQLSGFEQALDLIEPACDGLLIALQRRLA